MILPSYHIGPSGIAGAGRGLFLDEPLARGRLVIAPDAIPRVYTFEDVLAMPDAAQMLPATVRWFEDRYTVTPDWPDECYVNHAFEPTALWHLGFVFAAADLAAGTEITVDYRHLRAPGQDPHSRHAARGEAIAASPWPERLRASPRALATLIA